MIKISSFVGVLIAGALLAGCQTTGSNLSKADQAESAKLAKTVPIADLHDHDDHARWFGEEVGVVWAGLGAKGGGRFGWLNAKKASGDKRIAWAGQSELKRAFLSRVPKPDDPDIVALYEESEKDLKDGLIVGIGELFVNNRTSNKNRNFTRKGPADAPFIRKFYDLIAKYDGFLAFHMQADSDSMEQMGKLLASNRKGRIVWNHCGTDSSASEVREMFDKHPNLFCELSSRYPPVNKNRSREIFNSGGISSSWRQLMEDHSDRFMIGTDAHSGAEFTGSIKTVRSGLLPNLTPATARKIAYQNAQRLFKLKDNPGS